MACIGLPEGWKREEIIRSSGLSAGQMDVYYYSPSGKKIGSKPQLSRYLGESVDLTTFDFRTGKVNASLLRKNKRVKGSSFEYGRNVRGDTSLIPPIRQTASIFKQPVTVIKSQPDSKVRHDLKHGTQDKPKQLFWEKSLESLRASSVDEEEPDTFELPKKMRGVGPNMNEETLLRSIATALHVHTQPITGQTNSRENLERDPGVFINPDQPLIQALTISEEDIKRQEERVQKVRHRLEEALNELS